MRCGYFGSFVAPHERVGDQGRITARFEGGESGVEVVERHRRQFEEIADLHRGETALVVGHQTALGIVVPALARNVTPAWARDHELANIECVELEVDADGWVLTVPRIGQA